MSSNIPSAPAYGVYASQLIHYAHCCSSYSDFLIHHRAFVKRHSNTHLTPNLPTKIASHDPFPSIIVPTANDHLLEQLENEEIQTMFNQNSEVGFGVTQMTSQDPTLPDEIQQFFTDERPWGTDRNLRQVYVQNFPRIRDSETLNRRSRIYLRYLNHSNSPLIETIAHATEDIFYHQTNAFKMNL